MPLSKYKLVSCVVILAAIFLVYEFIQVGYHHPKTLVTLQQLELRNSRIGYHHGNKEATSNSTGVNDTVAEVNTTEDGFICVNESQLLEEFIRTHDIQDVHEIEQLLHKSSVERSPHHQAIRDVPLEDIHMYDLPVPQIDEPPNSGVSQVREAQPKVPGFEKREGSKHVVQGPQVRKVDSGSKRQVKLSSSLLQLEAHPIQQNSDLLVERKFPQWQPSDKLNNYTHYLELAMNGSNTQITRHSMKADIIARGLV